MHWESLLVGTFMVLPVIRMGPDIVGQYKDWRNFVVASFGWPVTTSHPLVEGPVHYSVHSTLSPSSTKCVM